MPVRCIGCGEEFASGEAFDLHATGQRRASADAPKRCRTAQEMRELGMSMRGGGAFGSQGVWRMKPRNGSR
jgi:hypothetical protein